MGLVTALMGMFRGRESFAGMFGSAGIDTNGPGADYLFRALRGGIANRDLPLHLYERILRSSWYAYVRNPLAKRALDTTRDFVLGEGVRIKAADPRLQVELERHWNHARNHWETRLDRRVHELGMYGEWCQVPCVNHHNGDVTWVNIDPLMIQSVLLDPENPDQAKWILLKDSIPSLHIGSVGWRSQHCGKDGARRRLRVIHRDENIHSDTYGRLIGDVLWVGINRTGYSTRGLSDLTCVLDWIEMHEDFLIAVQEAARGKIAHLWDITIKGAGKKVLESFMEAFGSSPGSGAVRAHSDKVTIQNISPTLATAELEQHSRMIKRHICVGMGLPEHWLGEGAEGSGEGTVDAGTPATKRLRARARMMREILKLHLDFAMDQKRIAGQLPGGVDPSYKIITSPLAVIDMQRIAATILTTVQAMEIASKAGDGGEEPMLTRREAREVVLNAVAQFGVDAEALDRSSESPHNRVEARDVADPDTNDGPGTQPDQLAQRMNNNGGGLAAPGLGVPGLATLGGTS